MEVTQYSVVAYLVGGLADFVNRLHQRFNHDRAGWAPHVTILPPRSLEMPLAEPLEAIRKQCIEFQPFEVSLEGVSTFWPVSGVVYLSLSLGFKQLIELHDALNSGGLTRQEVHPYVPHVTIAQELDEEATQAVLADVSREWQHYKEANSFRVDYLVLVQQSPENQWIDLACIPLGNRSSPPSTTGFES